jgi:membrane-bound ClpP family serine protease
MVGRVGVVVSPLAPSGTVRVDGETWSAIAEGGDIGPGQQVRVLGLQGVVLRVVQDEP